MRGPRLLASLIVLGRGAARRSGPAQAADEALALRIRAAQLAFGWKLRRRRSRCSSARAFDAGRRRPIRAADGTMPGSKPASTRTPSPTCEEASRLDPDSGEAALLLGVSAYQAGDIETAETALTRAEALRPERRRSCRALPGSGAAGPGSPATRPRSASSSPVASAAPTLSPWPPTTEVSRTTRRVAARRPRRRSAASPRSRPAPSGQRRPRRRSIRRRSSLPTRFGAGS